MNAKQIYHRLKKSKELSIIRLHRRKMWVSEWIAIIRKRGLYKDIHWTQEQKAEFNAFWKQHYGKRISPRWHKLYQSINGVFDVKYMPDVLFSTKLELQLNPFSLCEQLQSKTFPELLLGGELTNGTPGVRLPKTFAVCFGGYYYNSSRQICSYESLLAGLSDIGISIVKPAYGGSSGHDFRITEFKDGRDQRTGEPIHKVLDAYQGNFIVQEKLEQCEAVKKLYPGSINTFRVITYVCEGEVFHCPISLRVGSGKGEVDNIHSGGMGIGVTDQGNLMDRAFKLGYCDNKDTFTTHPDSGIIFSGYHISNIARVIDAAHRLHGRLPGIGIISWDFILGKDEEPVILETNLMGQAVWFPQIVNNCSAFSENTERMLYHYFGLREK